MERDASVPEVQATLGHGNICRFFNGAQSERERESRLDTFRSQI
jgi:hypothetical protein